MRLAGSMKARNVAIPSANAFQSSGFSTRPMVSQRRSVVTPHALSSRRLQLPPRRQLHHWRRPLRRIRQHLRQTPHPIPLPGVDRRLQRDLQRVIRIHYAGRFTCGSSVQMRPTPSRFPLVFQLIPHAFAACASTCRRAPMGCSSVGTTSPQGERLTRFANARAKRVRYVNDVGSRRPSFARAGGSRGTASSQERYDFLLAVSTPHTPVQTKCVSHVGRATRCLALRLERAIRTA